MIEEKTFTGSFKTKVIAFLKESVKDEVSRLESTDRVRTEQKQVAKELSKPRVSLNEDQVRGYIDKLWHKAGSKNQYEGPEAEVQQTPKKGPEGSAQWQLIIKNIHSPPKTATRKRADLRY